MTIKVTAILTAYQRVDQTLNTLRILYSCKPAPSDILVHVDGNETDTLKALQRAFPEVRYILSSENIGPGGGRNKLISAAIHDLVASFDDDSYPIDADYFARVVRLAEAAPKAAIIVGHVFHRGEPLHPDERTVEWTSDFIGCGCIYRRSIFLQTMGYVPLPTAYGMEEVDLALRLHADGKQILKTAWLRVFHDTDLTHHALPDVTASSIANLFLLTFLRYPVIFWPVGMVQVIKRLGWLMTHGRRNGILAGLCRVPTCLWKNRPYRATLSVRSVASYLRLRRNPLTIPWPVSLS